MAAFQPAEPLADGSAEAGFYPAWAVLVFLGSVILKTRSGSPLVGSNNCDGDKLCISYNQI